jgi:glutathione S-transferase
MTTGDAVLQLVVTLTVRRVRMAPPHKGLQFEVLPRRFAERETVLGILDEPSRDYFRASREAMFGATLEEVNAPDAETGRANLAKGLKPFDEALKNVRFLGGNQMSYADCALFGVLKWADIAGKYRSIDEGSHVGQWFTTLESMFNGYAAKAPRFREVGAYA